MPQKKDKKTHNIFCVDVEKIKSSLFDGNDCTSEEIINTLMAESSAQKYKEQKLKPKVNTDGFVIRLFFYGEEKYNSKLESFCASFVQDGEPIINFKPKTASSILFICGENHFFAVTTGQGFRIIESYCVAKFGMQVAGIFDKFRITGLDSNAMSSIVHSTKTIYSNEVDFIDVNNLDIIFKEVTGKLADKSAVHTLLGLDSKSKKNALKITAKNYVQLGSSLNFEGLMRVLKIFDGYDLSQLTDRFNLVVPLTVKHNKTTIEENNKCVIEKIYNALQADTYLGVDLFHKNTNDFINADSYKMTYDGTELVEVSEVEPLSFIKDAYTQYLDGDSNTIEAFTCFFEDAKIDANREELVLTSGSLLKHISGEITVDGINYYVFYGDYYCLNNSYSERLNATLSGKLRKEYFEDVLSTSWMQGQSEDDFNHLASTNEGYVHLHRTKPEQIEFADLIKIENNIATIIHVKDGFDCSMRELERQVELSMVRLLDLKNNNQESYMRKLYQNGTQNKKGINISTIFLTEQDFIEQIKNSVPRYVIAIRVKNSDLLSSDSNIAKHCLNSLILKCFNLGIDLKINLL